MPNSVTLVADGQLIATINDVEIYRFHDQLFALEFHGDEEYVRIPWLDEIARIPMGHMV